MAGELPPLIPRETLLGSPKRWQPRLSPDGVRLAYLAPNERDVLQVWVRTLGQDNGRCVSLAPRPVQFYGWSWDSKTIFTPRTLQATRTDIFTRSNWHPATSVT
jgi:hypothetical protein